MDLIKFSDIKRTARKYTHYNSFTCEEGEKHWNHHSERWKSESSEFKKRKVKVEGRKYRVSGEEGDIYLLIFGEPICPYYRKMEDTQHQGYCKNYTYRSFVYPCPYSGRTHMYMKRPIGYDQLW